MLNWAAVIMAGRRQPRDEAPAGRDARALRLVEAEAEARGDNSERTRERIVNVPDPWTESYARLRRAPRLRGWSEIDWERMLLDAGDFLTGWGTRAAELGWSELELFGVHRIAPYARLDVMGLIPMLKGARVLELGPTVAIMKRGEGNVLSFYRRNDRAVRHAEVTLIWNCARANADGGQS
jgi:hypothetical protein